MIWLLSIVKKCAIGLKLGLFQHIVSMLVNPKISFYLCLGSFSSQFQSSVVKCLLTLQKYNSVSLTSCSTPVDALDLFPGSLQWFSCPSNINSDWCPHLCLLQMNLLLKEYLISGDVSEAEHCLRDLEVPHFHHELVYEVFSQSCLRFWCLFVLHQFITTRFKRRCVGQNL